MKTGYGDASACLKLRIPVTRRDRRGSHQIACLFQAPEMARNSDRPVAASCPGDAPLTSFDLGSISLPTFGPFASSQSMSREAPLGCQGRVAKGARAGL
jgi:hypothetical protein